MEMELIELDGSQGEGGGQVLRTALTLSMITGKAFRMKQIRAKRAKPGLLRQHLTAVQAAKEISGAQVTGAEPSSQSLHFVPGSIEGGDFRFAIGTAGSCTLVLQTILPALWFAHKKSSVAITGGTHNPAAPPADFVIKTWLPLMRRMGVDMDIELVRHGFYPAGGGEVQARVVPSPALKPLSLENRGELESIKAIAIVAGVPNHVAKRELERVSAQLGAIDHETRELSPREGPGNALLVELRYQMLTEIFTAFGERGVQAETVADKVAKEARHFRDSSAAVGEHLADQLVLPMALARSGSFTVAVASSHLMTNMEVIEKFLPVKFAVTEGQRDVRIEVH